MPWIYGLVGLLVGAILGIIISRIKTPQYKKYQQMKKELTSAKFALEQQKQELTDHFSQSAELLDVIGKDYTKLYQHMVNSSAEMLTNLPIQDQPFAQKPAEDKNLDDSEPENQPKDYAQGSTGLLTPEKKEFIDAPDVVKTS